MITLSRYRFLCDGSEAKEYRVRVPDGYDTFFDKYIVALDEERILERLDIETMYGMDDDDQILFRVSDETLRHYDNGDHDLYRQSFARDVDNPDLRVTSVEEADEEDKCLLGVKYYTSIETICRTVSESYIRRYFKYSGTYYFTARDNALVLRLFDDSPLAANELIKLERL